MTDARNARADEYRAELRARLREAVKALEAHDADPCGLPAYRELLVDNLNRDRVALQSAMTAAKGGNR